jgi:hypothetical protein
MSAPGFEPRLTRRRGSDKFPAEARAEPIGQQGGMKLRGENVAAIAATRIIGKRMKTGNG